jgi:hypothetical protein
MKPFHGTSMNPALAIIRVDPELNYGGTAFIQAKLGHAPSARTQPAPGARLQARQKRQKRAHFAPFQIPVYSRRLIATIRPGHDTGDEEDRGHY